MTSLAATGLGDFDLSGSVALPEALGFSATPKPAAAPDPTQRPQLHVVPDPDADVKARKAADERLAEARAALGEAEKEHRSSRRVVEKLRAKTCSSSWRPTSSAAGSPPSTRRWRRSTTSSVRPRRCRPRPREAADEAKAAVEAARAARGRLS